MRRKSYFLCAPAQVIGWIGRSPARVRPSSSLHDSNCGRNAALERVPLRTATAGSRKWCWTSLSAPKGALSMRTYPGNWVGRAVSYSITHHFLRRRLRVRQRRRHEGTTSCTARVSHPYGAGPPCVRPKAPFLCCAPTQVVGWVGLCATTLRLWAFSGAPSTILVARRGCAQ